MVPTSAVWIAGLGGGKARGFGVDYQLLIKMHLHFLKLLHPVSLTRPLENIANKSLSINLLESYTYTLNKSNIKGMKCFNE